MVDSRSVMLVCSSPGDGTDNVVSYRFDAFDGSVMKSRISAAENPYYLSVHPTEEYVYTVDRTAGGLVSAYRIDDSDVTLTRLNRRPSGGAGPCYVFIDSYGHYVYVANYGGGTVSAFSVDSDGRLGVGTTLEFGAEGRKSASHPHSIAPGPTEGVVYAPDLGHDRIVSLFHRSDGALESARFPMRRFRREPGRDTSSAIRTGVFSTSSTRSIRR